MRPFISRLIFLCSLAVSAKDHLEAQDSSSLRRVETAIAVSKEPRHHNVFENKWVRVLDVHIPPGDTSFFHKHETPSVFIVLTNTKTGSEAIIEPAKPRLTYGNIWFEGFYDKPRIHRVWNSDTTEFHVMDIELPNRQNRQLDLPPSSLIGQASDQLLFDEKPVVAYRCLLTAKKALRFNGIRDPVLIVRMGEGSGASNGKFTVNGRVLQKKGDYAFVPVGEKLDISNQEDEAVQIVCLELK
jgi:hypothetical protein